MSGIDLDAIKARCEAASAGPWETDAHSHREDGCFCLSCYRDPSVILTTNTRFCDEQPTGDPKCPVQGYTWEDAEFIAHARTDIPALIAEIERLRAREQHAIEYERKIGRVEALRAEMADGILPVSRWWGALVSPLSLPTLPRRQGSALHLTRVQERGLTLMGEVNHVIAQALTEQMRAELDRRYGKADDDNAGEEAR